MIEYRCPLRIDRNATDERRRGWSGDPVSRYIRCEVRMLLPDGSYESYPNGPRVTFSTVAGDALRAHWERDHAPADYASPSPPPAR